MESDFSDDSLESVSVRKASKIKTDLETQNSANKSNSNPLVDKSKPTAKKEVPATEVNNQRRNAARCRPVSRHLSSKVFTKSRIPRAQNHKFDLKKKNSYLSQFYEKLMQNPSSLRKVTDSMESLCGSSVQSFNSCEMLNENTVEEENLLFESLENQLSIQRRFESLMSNNNVSLNDEGVADANGNLQTIIEVTAEPLPKPKSKFSQTKPTPRVPAGTVQNLKTECTSSRTSFLKKYNNSNSRIGYPKAKKVIDSAGIDVAEHHQQPQPNHECHQRKWNPGNAVDEVYQTRNSNHTKSNDTTQRNSPNQKAIRANEGNVRRSSSYLEQFKNRLNKC